MKEPKPMNPLRNIYPICLFYVPEGNTKTMEELMNQPFDAIYIIRKQTERQNVSKNETP